MAAELESKTPGSAAAPFSARVGKPAPSWTGDAVVGHDFVPMKSSDFLGRYHILFFYPLDFTFTEICEFNDRLAEFKAINCDVVACSIDSKFSHLAWAKTPRNKGGLGKLEMPLLSDVTKSIAKAYGVLVDEGADAGVALRGLFIVDPKGVLRQSTINDLPVGRNVDEALRLVQAFQFVDENGDEVCPINWRPNKRSLNTKKADEFFASGATAKGRKDEGTSDATQGAAKRPRN